MTHEINVGDVVRITGGVWHDFYGTVMAVSNLGFRVRLNTATSFKTVTFRAESLTRLDA